MAEEFHWAAAAVAAAVAAAAEPGAPFAFAFVLALAFVPRALTLAGPAAAAATSLRLSPRRHKLARRLR